MATADNAARYSARIADAACYSTPHVCYVLMPPPPMLPLPAAGWPHRATRKPDAYEMTHEKNCTRVLRGACAIMSILFLEQAVKMVHNNDLASHCPGPCKGRSCQPSISCQVSDSMGQRGERPCGPRTRPRHVVRISQL